MLGCVNHQTKRAWMWRASDVSLCMVLGYPRREGRSRSVSGCVQWSIRWCTTLKEMLCNEDQEIDDLRSKAKLTRKYVSAARNGNQCQNHLFEKCDCSVYANPMYPNGMWYLRASCMSDAVFTCVCSFYTGNNYYTVKLTSAFRAEQGWLDS